MFGASSELASVMEFGYNPTLYRFMCGEVDVCVLPNTASQVNCLSSSLF